MTSTSEKSNLARVRDNQRRSRARRKEYLQELEARLRQCELQGIEASSEIQLAARRVADENKKLRALLAQTAVPYGLETYVQSLSSSDGSMALPADQNGASSGAVQALEQLLLTRKACCIDDADSLRMDQRSSRHTETTGSDSSARSSWESHERRPHRAIQQSSDVLTPTATKTTRPRSINLVYDPSCGSSPLNRFPSADQVQQINERSGPQTPNLYDYGPQCSPTRQSSYSQYQPHHQHSVPYNGNTHTQALNVNSCVFAADMIMTMAGGDPSAVRSDLGCLPGGGHCDVDNQLVFNVMDRYTSSGVGL